MSVLFTDIAIIGAGASGLLCACTAADKFISQNKRLCVTLFEKQQRVGKKILSTGNGRCNLTNTSASGENYHGSFARYINSLYKKYPPEAVIRCFNKIGLLCTEETQGRVYPLCRQASAVLDVLRYEAKRKGVSTLCDAEVFDIKKSKGMFLISTSQGNFEAKKVVIATGGKAAPSLGSDVKILDVLKKLGHSCQRLTPALCPVRVNNSVIRSLKGVRCEAEATLLCNGKAVKTEKGEIQFADNALSGICIFNLSSYVNSGKKEDNFEISIDLLPNFNDDKVDSLIRERIKIFENEPVEVLFTGLFHKRIGEAVLKQSDIAPLSRECRTLNKDETTRLCRNIKEWRFNALPSSGFDNAQVTAGGIVGNEISFETMESKIVKNLYFCGEVIDIYGDCGGYNLQFAFASALAAGENL